MKRSDVYSDANNKLNSFLNYNIQNYRDLRNYDYGPKNRENVSCLSPYISHRVLLEYNIINRVLGTYKFSEVEKFIQEILWKVYWRGFLENRPLIWSDFTESIGKIDSALNPIDSEKYSNAIAGKTGIGCFDQWIFELKEFNYLHNHARMWFASIWIFTLKLPWQLGAKIFLEHLLDGDPAANTLSWRWVAGIHTQGKNYLASQKNIDKFSNISVRNLHLNQNEKPITETKNYTVERFKYKINYFKSTDNLLVFDTDLYHTNHTLDFAKYKNIFIVLIESNDRIIKMAENVALFKKKILIDFQQAIPRSVIVDLDCLECNFNSFSEMDVIYPFVGENLDYLSQCEKRFNIKFNMIFRKNDILCWKFAKKGYFNFRKNFPEILSRIAME